MFSREVVEGRQAQGANEQVAYAITTTPWGSSPSSATFKLYDITADAWEDVTTAKTSGSVGTSGNVITSPLVISLVAGRLYRGVFQFVASGNTFEAWVEILGER